MYKTTEDIIKWIKSYANPKENLTKFAIDLGEQIKQLNFELPENAKVMLYSGNFMVDKGVEANIFQTVAEHVSASDGKLAYINNVADNILNNQKFKDALREVISKEHADDLLHGSWKGNVRLTTVFGDQARPLDDIVSEQLVQLHAKGDVPVLLAPSAHANGVFAQTELPALLKNPNVTHVNGIPKEQLTSMSTIEQFNAIKVKSVSELMQADVYRVRQVSIMGNFVETIAHYEHMIQNKANFIRKSIYI